MTAAPDAATPRAEVFSLLAAGVADAASPWHAPTLATVRPDGAPAMRTVILRAFDPVTRQAELHTDSRSAKFAELTANSWAGLHIWDPVRLLQVRLTGRATLLTGAAAGGAWDRLGAGSRATYAVAPGPGEPIRDPADAVRATHPGAGRGVFTVVRLSVAELDWLHLASQGHRRARFAWADGVGSATWLVP